MSALLAFLSCTALLTRPMVHTAQTTDYTCGPACLRSVLLYWKGAAPSELELARLLRTDPQIGTANARLVEAARELGLEAEQLTGLKPRDLRRLVRQGNTLILDWMDRGERHFSVLVGLDLRYIYLMDPWVDPGRPPEISRRPLRPFLRAWGETPPELRNGAIRILNLN
jgi:predicted double-glycine peptidase